MGAEREGGRRGELEGSWKRAIHVHTMQLGEITASRIITTLCAVYLPTYLLDLFGLKGFIWRVHEH